MIGSLRGRLAVKAPPQLLLEVGGVGYELEAPMSTFYGLPAIGEEVRLLTHLVVREDAHVLYGFASEAERQLFRSLLKVTGVGPKMALGILSGTSVEGFAACVTLQDATALTRIPGIGRKTDHRDARSVGKSAARLGPWGACRRGCRRRGLRGARGTRLQTRRGQSPAKGRGR